MSENAADPAATKRKKQRDRNRDQTFDNDLRVVLSTPQGRRFLTWLLERGMVLQSCRAPDVYDAMRNEGRQEFGHQILAEVMRVCPERYRAAMEEQEEYERRGR